MSSSNLYIESEEVSQILPSSPCPQIKRLRGRLVSASPDVECLRNTTAAASVLEMHFRYTVGNHKYTELVCCFVFFFFWMATEPHHRQTYISSSQTQPLRHTSIVFPASLQQGVLLEGWIPHLHLMSLDHHRTRVALIRSRRDAGI